MDSKQKVEDRIQQCLDLKPRDEEYKAVDQSLTAKLEDLKKSLEKAPKAKKKIIEKMITKIESDIQENERQSKTVLEEQHAKYSEELTALKKDLLYTYIDTRNMDLKEFIKEKYRDVFSKSETEFEIQLKQSLDLKTSEETTVSKSKDRKLKKFIKIDCDYAITSKGEKIPLTEKDAAMIINYPIVIKSKAVGNQVTAPPGSRTTFGTAST